MVGIVLLLLLLLLLCYVSVSSSFCVVLLLKVMAHPHLSQALLGNGATAGTSSKEVVASTATVVVTTTTPTAASQQAAGIQGQSNTSLIKSLLATKVNNCMTTVSMRTATDCQNVAQVTPLIQRRW